ncbi:MAG: CaiB/BaiF CoA-transferase family protein [Xanthomonadales bacterium]|jgi:alpha-methylacyl-CoA racemase|nr:CaiB/BaiF CoA-transferase family protein [Xanthomonadales bacterium]
MGPLKGYRIIEIAGIGPGQFCGMLLSDLGADVLRLERPGFAAAGFDIPREYNLMNRGRSNLAVDLKSEQGRELVLRLCRKADALFEGFRPGVMERLGLGPGACHEVNPGLVYGRMTGWGQDGPLAQRAGHDGNFVALSGVMTVLAEKGGPPLYAPMLPGDLAGGGAYLALGILAALLERGRSGQGQVVDAAIVDGAIHMLTPFIGFMEAGIWSEGRGSNILDGAAPFVGAYATSDGKHVFVSPLEPKFFAVLLKRMGLEDIDVSRQYDPSYWAVIRQRLKETFAQKTRDEWSSVLEGVDACCTPVLSPAELGSHEHLRARRAMIEVDGVEQPAPAPKFSRTPGEIRHGPGRTQPDPEVLKDWGLRPEEITLLLQSRDDTG